MLLPHCQKQAQNYIWTMQNIYSKYLVFRIQYNLVEVINSGRFPTHYSYRLLANDTSSVMPGALGWVTFRENQLPMQFRCIPVPLKGTSAQLSASWPRFEPVHRSWRLRCHGNPSSAPLFKPEHNIHQPTHFDPADGGSMFLYFQHFLLNFMIRNNFYTSCMIWWRRS
jgi:hypothetical protein